MSAKKTVKTSIDTTGEGVSEDNDERESPSETWLPKQSATSVTGLDPRKLHYLGESKQVRRRKAPNGVWEYALADLEPFCKADESSLANDLVRESNEHARESFKLAFGPAKELFSLLRDENQSLRAQNSKLLETHLELVKARETILSEAHERALAEQEVQARIQARADMMTIGKQVLPVIAKQLLANPESANIDSRLEAAKEFMARIPPHKVAAMLETDFLTDEEKALLCMAMGRPPPEPTNNSESTS